MIPAVARQQRRLVADPRVHGIDQRDGRFPPRVIGAARDRVTEQRIRPEMQALTDRRFQIALAMVERQLELGQTQHGRDIASLPARPKLG